MLFGENLKAKRGLEDQGKVNLILGEEHDGERDDRKKLCTSLHISNTCLRISSIGLKSTSSEESGCIPCERENSDTDTDVDLSFLLEET